MHRKNPEKQGMEAKKLQKPLLREKVFADETKRN
jgi:hypothetical protein